MLLAAYLVVIAVASLVVPVGVSLGVRLADVPISPTPADCFTSCLAGAFRYARRSEDAGLRPVPRSRLPPVLFPTIASSWDPDRSCGVCGTASGLATLVASGVAITP